MVIYNSHTEETVLDLLDYTNLERIWIERTEHDVKEGRRTVTRRTFDLHVIRNTESGTAYEDTMDHLSESERVPVMLLDSLEAIDSDRIARLVEHVADPAGFLIAALLPEDAAALDSEFQRISEI